jgi:hypothetical protein
MNVQELEVDETLISLSPAPVLTLLGTTLVVRDDLLPGGTKQRASAPFIQDMINLGFNHFVYASPFAGFAQVALAYVCQILGVRSTIVCERDQRFAENQFHPFSLLAQSYGAKLIMVNSLKEAEGFAEAIGTHQNRTLKIPLGFDCPEFRFHLKNVISDAFKNIERRTGRVKNLWMPVGSGTLVRTFLTAIPERVKFKCVNVRVLNNTDPRITAIVENPRIEYFEAPMPFHSEATDFPDIPSNTFYDAKLWDFIKKYGRTRDVWWNVAR